jgi:hypothetical protein
MRVLEQLVAMTERNLRAVISAEKQSKKDFERGYYKGKTDALSHILDTLEGKYDGA